MMSVLQKASPAKLIANIIYSPQTAMERVANALQDRFGGIDVASRPLPFTESDYYEREMGVGLMRRLLAFAPLIDREQLFQIKLTAMELERKFADVQGNRMVNIDPGYVTLENFVLSSGKNFSHRIYMRDGVYAEVTLVFKGGSFRPLDWTYPFYRRDEVIDFLNRVRERYRWHLSGV